MSPVLSVKDLRVQFARGRRQVNAVNGLSFDLGPGECLGVVGESGSGKTQSFLAMLGLLARNGSAAGSVRFQGREILNAPKAQLQRLRGDRMSMMFQDALSGLTPNLRIGHQLEEVLMVHRGLSRIRARQRALKMLEIVKIAEPEQRYNAYPFELSGGMRQRVMIALALLCEPDVLICDEPTTALDVTVQAQVLKLLDSTRRHTDTAIILITHDLGVVAGLCDSVMIMYAGRAVETGSVDDIFYQAAHPYTQGLLRSVPRLDADPEQPLPAISGQPPILENLPAGCAFAGRCDRYIQRCAAGVPELRLVAESHAVACLRAEVAS
jgi:oligopeptide transport system ATP-binding protein